MCDAIALTFLSWIFDPAAGNGDLVARIPIRFIARPEKHPPVS